MEKLLMFSVYIHYYCLVPGGNKRIFQISHPLSLGSIMRSSEGAFNECHFWKAALLALFDHLNISEGVFGKL